MTIFYNCIRVFGIKKHITNKTKGYHWIVGIVWFMDVYTLQSLIQSPFENDNAVMSEWTASLIWKGKNSLNFVGTSRSFRKGRKKTCQAECRQRNHFILSIVSKLSSLHHISSFLQQKLLSMDPSNHHLSPNKLFKLKN